MKHIVLYQKWITRIDLLKNPFVSYLFGDNVARTGMGGQAREMRGLPNAVGIATKWEPATSNQSYFSDVDFNKIKDIIDSDFSKIVNEIVVVPHDGLGTGYAKLPEKAPKIFEYVKQKVINLSL